MTFKVRGQGQGHTVLKYKSAQNFGIKQDDIVNVVWFPMYRNGTLIEIKTH